MDSNVTRIMMDEHQLILRMINLVEFNAALVETGELVDGWFFLNAVDFIRNYADRFHHAKEEDVLFVELVKNGMPEKRSPIEAMLIEHDQGRDLVQLMETAASRLVTGETGMEQELVEAARSYATLLREHIRKEDEILYPLAERTLPDRVRCRMQMTYAASAERMSGVEARFRQMVESYEMRMLGRQGRQSDLKRSA